MTEVYVAIAQGRRVRASDGWYDDDPGRVTLNVIDDDANPIDTGLLDENGTRLFRVNQRAPMGFRS